MGASHDIADRCPRQVLDERTPHEWKQEADLFEWEALLTENKELRRILAEAGAWGLTSLGRK